jgi:acyl-CoA reductase-like NAD-dependent aldehyde dehydrogenase
MSTERIIVQRSVADAFRKVLTETTERIFGKHTPPQILISGAAVQRNKALVSNAVAKGAQLLYGDHKPQEATATCLRPMVVENVTRDMDLYFTESFGPTVSLYVVDTEDQAIELANDTEYGLTVAVYSENLRRGLRMQDRLKLGTTPLLHVKVSHYT